MTLKLGLKCEIIKVNGNKMEGEADEAPRLLISIVLIQNATES